MTERGGMGLVFGIFVAVLLLTIAGPAAATELGNVAAAMAPGTWAVVSTNNAGVISQLFSSIGGNPGYDDNCAAWNSKKRKMMIQTVSDPGAMSHPNFPLAMYDDDTNTWSVPGPAPSGSSYHCYDGMAWDDANEVLYWRPGNYGQATIYRYCFNNSPTWCEGRQGVWSSLPSDIATGGCYQIGVALTYHATMDGGSLLCYDGERGIVQFRESTGTWSNVLSGTLVSGTGPYSVCAEYSPVKRVTVFGCGGGTGMYKITDSKTVTRLADAPSALGLGVNNHDLLADPVSGNYIVVNGYAPGQGRLYEFNPDGTGTWTLLDSDLRSAGEICNTVYDSSAGCSADFYGAANPTYGVIMYWKYTGASTGQLWLYKHKASTPPAAPTSLTVK